MQLQQLKKAYDGCRLSQESYNQLLHEREALHDEILTKTADLEGGGNRLEKQRHLEELKRCLRDIDHQIDALGENHEEEIASLRKELVEEIHKASPDSLTDYERLTQLFEALSSEETSDRALLERLRPFQSALNEGATSKKSRGLLGILFGRNEKVLLARSIRKASVEAERIYKEVKDPEVRPFLERFLEEANRPWNSALYKERFYTLHQTFSKLIEEIKKRQTHARRAAIQAQQEIEIWIERHCRESR